MPVDDVTVIIPTSNGGRALSDAVASVGSEAQLVVVDNGSADGSVPAAGSNLRVMKNETNLGFAPACNQGAAGAKTRYVCFLNSDAVVVDDALEALIAFADNDPDTAIWQPAIFDSTATKVDSCGDLFTWTGFFDHVTNRPDSPRPIFAVKGVCMLMRTDVFKQLGGFRDEFFAYFEESDLCWRAQLAGWQVRVVPAISVRHVGGLTTRRILNPSQVRYLSFRNRFASILSNTSATARYRIVPVHVAIALVSAAALTSTGRLDSAWAIVRALVWPVTHGAQIRKWRTEVEAVRKVSDADLLNRTDVVSRLGLRRLVNLARGQLFRWERPQD